MQCIRLLREILGIKQGTLAAATGLSRQSLSEFENGRSFPSRETAQAMDASMMQIIEERAVEASLALREQREARRAEAPVDK
jgi:DNA-binding XRE family transcriptional regulator